MKKHLLILIAYIFALSIWPSHAYAAPQNTSAQPVSGLSLAVSPGIKELIISPGKPQTITAQVTNISTRALPISVRPSKFETTEGIAERDQRRFNASAWLKVTEPEFILQPNQTRAVNILAVAPIDAEPGGHYATVYFQPHVPVQVLQQNGAQIGARVGMLTLLVVKGNLIEDASISGFTSSMSDQSGPVSFDLTLKNNGNTHFIPSGYIEILDWQNKPITTIPLPISLVLPKTEKTIKLNWDNAGRIGKFSAHPVISYGARTKNLTNRTVVFWIVPWLTTLFWALLIAVICFVLYYGRGRWNRALQALKGHTDNQTTSNNKVRKKR